MSQRPAPLLPTASRRARVPWTARAIVAAGCLALGAFSVTRAHAVPPTINLGNAAEAEDDASSGVFGFLSNWRRSANFLGNMWGLRPELGKYGAVLAVQETSEVFGNATGGNRRGVDYDGLTQAVLQINTQRAFGWYGGTFNVSMEQIHGRSLSQDNLQALQTISGIEADRSTRLWELWFDQKFLDQQQLDIKIGQQSLDQEYMISSNALIFANTMFGWPMVPSADLPGGGPAYPLSALGVRGKYWLATPLYVLGGVYSGSPTRALSGDPQQTNASGTSFPLDRGVMAIAEIQYVYPALGAMVSPDDEQPLSHVYRLGGWYDSEPFADQYYDNTGTPLASPASNGTPVNHRGAFSFYAVMDQMLWRSHVDPNRTINMFGRAMGTPQADRVPVDFSLNYGVTMKDPFPYRTDDTFGLAMGYTHVSSALARYDRAVHQYTGVYSPPQGGETYVEATYQYQFTGWMQWQPDFQYIFNPGGGIPNPSHPDHHIHNELVLGFRTNIAL
ncbi:carbohydrate porin [Gluconacetobacter diazotrophicus]|uniref:Putative carbohydrate-selective porin n=1 Tax=Gluconacetobacter diazotrophicus (strain ATCC 49037 / DSM 5601 / CCUG 37298 / CIP 103539 / LMG 7603 / PAl5) TaxID=272568 RepID=A9H726_GLUDA|nr:carbohydrate porin [Gluconacetobacter diazotrophicus]CAP57586.1 putative carbohydrate-selective porin [Gluconacetobacter diazotrophicus PA1 5]